MLWIAIGLLALLCAVLAGGLWLVDHLLVSFAQERSIWSQERGFLIQRLQAPATAVAQYTPPDTPDEPEQEPSEEEMRVYHSEQDEILHQLGRL